MDVVAEMIHEIQFEATFPDNMNLRQLEFRPEKLMKISRY